MVEFSPLKDMTYLEMSAHLQSLDKGDDDNEEWRTFNEEAYGDED